MCVTRRLGAVLVTLLLVTSSLAVSPVGGAFSPSAESSVDETDGISVTADAAEVYVDETGTAVLVYELAHGNPALEGEFGFNSDTVTGSDYDSDSNATALAYIRYADESAEDAADTVGDVSIRTERDVASGSGDVVVRSDESIAELDADVEVRRNDAESFSRGDVRAVVTDRDLPYPAVTTSGELEVTPESVTGSGTISTTEDENASGGVPLPPETESLAVDVSETDDGYVLTVRERRSVESWETNRWDTRADAHDSLDNRFASVAIGLGGTADGSLESYNFTRNGDRGVLEYEYDVAFTGVTEQAATEAASLIRDRADLDVNEIEVRAIADRLAAMEIDELSIAAERRGAETVIEWELEADAYDEFVLGAVELADSIEAIDDDLADRFDDVSAGVAARERTDLRQTTSWNVSAVDDGERTTIDATWATDAENWETHAAELAARELDHLAPDRTVSLRATPADDGTEVVYEFEVSDEDAIEWPLDELTHFAPDPIDADSVDDLETLFRTADLARADVRSGDGVSELEGAAVVENGTAARDALPIYFAESTISAIHVETGDGTSTAYVTLDGFTGADPTAAAVRDREQVGPETTVYMPGEWDREFPSIDRDRATALLGTDLDAADDGDGDDKRGVARLPGGGTIPAVTTVLAGVLAAVVLGAYAIRRLSSNRS